MNIKVPPLDPCFECELTPDVFCGIQPAGYVYFVECSNQSHHPRIHSFRHLKRTNLLDAVRDWNAAMDELSRRLTFEKISKLV